MWVGRWIGTARRALVRVIMWAGGEGTPEEWLTRAHGRWPAWTNYDEAPDTTGQVLDLRHLDQRLPAYAMRLERRHATAEERAQVVQNLQEWLRVREQIARHQPASQRRSKTERSC